MRVAANRARWREIAAVDFSGLMMMMMMMMMMMVMIWKHGRTPWLSLHSNRPTLFSKRVGARQAAGIKIIGRIIITTYILMLYPRMGSRDISDIPPKHPHFKKIN
jgi:hypothetical protein